MSSRVDDAPTAWSVILEARGTSETATAALGELFRRYEGSVLALLRRCQLPPSDTAEDVKQAFFARALDRGDFARLDPRVGRFRAWLRVAVTNFVKTRWAEWNAQKRGNTVTVALEREPASHYTPDRVFERNFAEDTLLHVLEQLRAELCDDRLFELARPFLPGDQPLGDLEKFASAVGKTSAAASVFLFRLRKTYRRLLSEAVAATLDLKPSDPSASPAIDAELRAMFELLCEIPESSTREPAA